MKNDYIDPLISYSPIKAGDYCLVIAGTHKGKEGVVGDLNVSKTGHLTVTITKSDGVRFKTLAKNLQKKN